MSEVPIRCTGVAVVLLKKEDDQHKVLLVKRAESVLKDEWCYIGGGIKEGEKAWEAAYREVEEETGITNLSLYSANTFDRIYSIEGNYIYIAPVFVGFVADDQEVVLNEEHSDYRWLSFEDAMGIVSLPGNEEVLSFIEKHFVKKEAPDYLLVRR
ncbi:NUDIX domain-containing protein [Rossellomorea vietnamensis]|uniref:NUDIX domain-containing protein n=1 Tax=Rossellomorea vietnamensis TaxID=218284 RepID=A0ACD4CCJ6_9BACI|nr:NUDIX domain-containing protein [Rossellomorea vietnamensis]UXH46255.1 NUDIX domain-containing protein [Rossellomorea vietnamensis]